MSAVYLWLVVGYGLLLVVVNALEALEEGQQWVRRESRFTLNQCILSLLRKLVSDSAVLTWAGSSFHPCGAKTEPSGDNVCLLLAMAVPDVQLR